MEQIFPVLYVFSSSVLQQPPICFQPKLAPTMTTLNLGIGALCTVKLNRLHPRRVVESLYTNAPHGQEVTDLLVIGQDKKVVNGREQVVILLRHESFDPNDVYAVKRWCRVTVEGPTSELFTQATEQPVVETVLAAGEEEQQPRTSASTRQEEIVQTIQDGFDVDDDDAPAPENIPTPDPPRQHQQTWGWDGICRRRQAQNLEHKASMKGQTEATIKSMTLLSMFLYWFPTEWSTLQVYQTQDSEGMINRMISIYLVDSMVNTMPVLFWFTTIWTHRL